MRKVYIFGASGFIGSNLQRDLSAIRDYELLGYSSKECNLLSLPAVEKALSSSTREDIAIIASGITRLRENSFESFKKNVLMAENFSASMRKYPLRRIIFLSTVDVYGLLNDNCRIKEDLLPDPDDYYALSKITSEYLIKKCCLDKNISMAILRLSGVYGPNDYKKSTLNRLIESAIKGRITIYGDGLSRRDFVYVKDISSIIQMIIATDENMLLNLATGRSYSIKQIVEFIRLSCSNSFNVEYRPEEKGAQQRARNMVYDISLLTKRFPNFNFTDIKDGISLYFKNIKEVEKIWQRSIY